MCAVDMRLSLHCWWKALETAGEMKASMLAACMLGSFKTLPLDGDLVQMLWEAGKLFIAGVLPGART